MNDWMIEKYWDLKGYAGGYYLSCARINQKREISRDRRELVELGNQLVKVLENHTIDDGYFLNSLEGYGLALDVEENWLKRDRAGEECARDLRELGIDSLDKLAGILIKAENRDEFDKYALHLAKLFKGWGSRAEEIYALHTPFSVEEVFEKVGRRKSA